jgi:hypothetical protein
MKTLTKKQFIEWYLKNEKTLAYTIDKTGYDFSDIPENGKHMAVWQSNGKHYFEW